MASMELMKLVKKECSSVAYSCTMGVVLASTFNDESDVNKPLFKSKFWKYVLSNTLGVEASKGSLKCESMGR